MFVCLFVCVCVCVCVCWTLRLSHVCVDELAQEERKAYFVFVFERVCLCVCIFVSGQLD